MEGKDVLKIKMQENDCNAETIGDYLHRLLAAVWSEGESFSGKRPFGNSGWEGELYQALAVDGAIASDKETYDSGDVEYHNYDEKLANAIIFSAIDSLFE